MKLQALLLGTLTALRDYSAAVGCTEQWRLVLGLPWSSRCWVPAAPDSSALLWVCVYRYVCHNNSGRKPALCMSFERKKAQKFSEAANHQCSKDVK